MPDRNVLHRNGTMSQSKLESRWSIVDGLRIHTRAIPSARPGAPIVVLVHGLGVSGRYFEPAMKALAGDRTLLAPDLPGTGRSASPRHVLDVSELAHALGRWLDVQGISRASFVANSMGCQVATRLAVIAADRVDRLVLVGPTVDPRWRSMRRQIARWLLEATREPLKIFPILLRDYLRFGPRRFFATGRHALEHRMEDDAPYVEAPTLVLRGARDAFVSNAWIETLAQSFPRARAATIPRAAHAAHFKAPDELARLVLPFLAETSHQASRLHLSGERSVHRAAEEGRGPARDGRGARRRVST